MTVDSIDSISHSHAQVISDKNNKRLTYGVAAVAGFLFLLWFFTMR